MYTIVITNDPIYKQDQHFIPSHLKQVYPLSNSQDQIVLLFLNHVRELHTTLERWCYLFKGFLKSKTSPFVMETKIIDNPAQVASGNKAILDFMAKLNKNKILM